MGEINEQLTTVAGTDLYCVASCSGGVAYTYGVPAANH